MAGVGNKESAKTSMKRGACDCENECREQQELGSASRQVNGWVVAGGITGTLSDSEAKSSRWTAMAASDSEASMAHNGPLHKSKISAL